MLSRLKNLHIFTANQDTKDKIKPLFPEEFWKKITVTYAYVSAEEIAEVYSSPLIHELEFPKFELEHEKITVFSLGNFIDRKGRWQLLEAAKIISELRDDIRFVWITPELPSPEDKEKIDSYGLRDGFFTLIKSSKLGESRLDVLRFLALADIFVLPSLVEGLPISLLEAMALGVPSVSTNINAIPEALIPNETGFLIEPDDPNALALAIIKYADDRFSALALAENARTLVLSKFEEKQTCGLVLSKYKSSLSEAV